MKLKNQNGFIKLVVLLVIGLVVLGYFGFDMENIVKSPTVSGNLHYAWNLAVAFWNNFLMTPASWIWDKLHGFLPNSY